MTLRPHPPLLPALLAALLFALGPLTALAAGAPASPEAAAIQQVVQHANDEQVQAIANHDSSVMADTSTSDHLQELIADNQELLASGVVGIKLLGIDWGEIDVNGDHATATTWETWSTSFDDGTSERARDENTYALVKDGDTWKIASDSHPEAAVPPTAPRPPTVLVPPRDGTSRNWSGYATTDGAYTAISASWTIPQPAEDGSFGASAAWVGIGGVTTPDLIQAGTEELVSPNGGIRYQAWIETLPAAARPISLTVNAGDAVTVALDEQDARHWHVAFTNTTTGDTFEEVVQYRSSHSSAEWVDEAPSTGRARLLPLDHFGTLGFTDASTVSADGTALSIADAGAKPITMIDETGSALAVPGPLGDDGASFTINRAGDASDD